MYKAYSSMTNHKTQSQTIWTIAIFGRILAFVRNANCFEIFIWVRSDLNICSWCLTNRSLRDSCTFLECDVISFNSRRFTASIAVENLLISLWNPSKSSRFLDHRRSKNTQNHNGITNVYVQLADRQRKGILVQ
jgi:hypothetical protein